MADPLLWATAIIAGASLIFAFIAFRQVMKSTSLVALFIQRADKFLKTFQDSAKGVFTPTFMAETLNRALLTGLENEDGSPVSMPQYVNGYVMAFGPRVYQDMKKEIPKYIPLILNPQSPPPGPPNPGRALVQKRWGSGGLTGATQNVATAAKKLPFGQKVAEYVEGAQALVQLGGTIRELKNEVMGAKGDKGENGGGGRETRSSDGGTTEWGPPF